MSNAARHGDNFSFPSGDLQIQQGSNTVFINDRRAVNVSELHRGCFGQGGAPGVFVEGMPAMRSGDEVLSSLESGTVGPASEDVIIGDYFVPSPATTPKIYVRIWESPLRTLEPGTVVVVRDVSGRKIFEGSLDNSGSFSFEPPRWGMYDVTLEDGTHLKVR